MSVEVTRLPSGLTVVTDKMPHLHTASLGVWVGSGSRDERPDEHGISHLLEHMAFKGTSRRNAREIAEEIESVGGILNAYTGREQTARRGPSGARGRRGPRDHQQAGALRFRSDGKPPRWARDRRALVTRACSACRR